MNIYEILTSYVSLPAYYVVAESIPEAKKMFLAKYPDFRTSDIKKIKLIAEDVIVSDKDESKPVVDESFVKVYVKMIKKDPHQCTRENLIGMLREAGVKVIID